MNAIARLSDSVSPVALGMIVPFRRAVAAAVVVEPANAEAIAALDAEDREGIAAELEDKAARRLDMTTPDPVADSIDADKPEDFELEPESATVEPVASAPVAPITPRAMVDNSKPGNAVVDRAAMMRAVEIASVAVEKRNTIPVLSNLALVAIGGNLQISGTDLDLEISVTVPGAVDDHFGVTIPAHTLKDVLKRAPGCEFVGFTVPTTEPTKGGPVFDGAAVVDFEKVNYRLQAIPTGDFPTMNVGTFSHAFDLAGVDLVEGFGRTAVAISTEETRYYLNGIYMHAVADRRCIFDADGNPSLPGGFLLRMVATDGHRLAMQDCVAPAGAYGMPGVIIPRKTVATLQKLIRGKACPENVRIELSESKIRFTFGDVAVTSKLVDGTFPDYQRVTPTGNDKPGTFATTDLEEAIKAVTVISSERGRAVKLSLDCGNCRLDVNNPDAGSASATVATDYASEHMEIGFNAKYLLDFIATIDAERMTFKFADAGAPTLVSSDDRPGWLGVLMPMRV